MDINRTEANNTINDNYSNKIISNKSLISIS